MLIASSTSSLLIRLNNQHKKRNVTDALPERMRSQVSSMMSQAYASGEVKRARQLLENLARSLERGYPGAAASLREGLDETLTVMRLDLPESLERVLSATNLIENLFSRVREMARRGRHWAGRDHDPQMVRGRDARSRAELPQDCRLPPLAKPRCALMMAC